MSDDEDEPMSPDAVRAGTQIAIQTLKHVLRMDVVLGMWYGYMKEYKEVTDQAHAALAEDTRKHMRLMLDGDTLNPDDVMGLMSSLLVSEMLRCTQTVVRMPLGMGSDPRVMELMESGLPADEILKRLHALKKSAS